jgi:hypothetical protein
MCADGHMIALLKQHCLCVASKLTSAHSEQSCVLVGLSQAELTATMLMFAVLPPWLWNPTARCHTPFSVVISRVVTRTQSSSNYAAPCFSSSLLADMRLACLIGSVHSSPHTLVSLQWCPQAFGRQSCGSMHASEDELTTHYSPQASCTLPIDACHTCK